MFMHDVNERPISQEEIDVATGALREKTTDCTFYIVLLSVFSSVILAVTVRAAYIDLGIFANIAVALLFMFAEIFLYSTVLIYLLKKKCQHTHALKQYDEIGPAECFEVDAWSKDHAKVDWYLTRLAVRERLLVLGEYEMIKHWVAKE